MLPLPTLLLVLLCDLQGGCDCTVPNLSLPPLSPFWSHMCSHWYHNIHDFLWDYKVRDRMA